MSAESKNEASKSHIRTRVFATFALGAFVAAAGWAGHQGYRAFTDSFVAPSILSPESDLVLQTKAKMAELEVERNRIVTEAEGIDADLASSDQALARLSALKTTIDSSLEWTQYVTARQATVSYKEIRALEQQKSVLGEMAEKQARIAREASANLAAGLISKTDQTKEQVVLDQMQLALLENGRARMQHEGALNAAYFAQKSLAAKGSALMPEAITREEQLVRIEIEMSRLQAEQRAKRAEKKVVLAKLAKMDELGAQLRGRPLFRATERSVEVAFVPYTQSEGVAAGSSVYDCVWSIFHCHAVGTITEVIPGEVVLPDPWGSPARGQLAVLDLTKHESARSKVLRVRANGTAPAATPASTPQIVSVR